MLLDSIYLLTVWVNRLMKWRFADADLRYWLLLSKASLHLLCSRRDNLGPVKFSVESLHKLHTQEIPNVEQRSKAHNSSVTTHYVGLDWGGPFSEPINFLWRYIDRGWSENTALVTINGSSCLMPADVICKCLMLTTLMTLIEYNLHFSCSSSILSYTGVWLGLQWRSRESVGFSFTFDHYLTINACNQTVIDDYDHGIVCQAEDQLHLQGPQLSPWEIWVNNSSIHGIFTNPRACMLSGKRGLTTWSDYDCIMTFMQNFQ